KQWHKKSGPVPAQWFFGATASESSEKQCLQLRSLKEHCLTEDGQAVAQEIGSSTGTMGL
ncbi:MAG: hypothetical protein WCH39_24440, partial [Schlesneria sp.]